MIMKKMKIVFMFFMLVCYSCTENNYKSREHHFSMTCKVDCINEQFITEEGRQKAMDFFKACKVDKIYLESYRHGVSVDSKILKEVRDAFTMAGIQCAGCITTTQMSKTVVSEWDITTCYTDSTGLGFLKETVQRTAKLFDLIILDDFFFTVCKCPLCQAARGNRTWEEFRKEQMLQVSQEFVLNAAKEVNPACKIIIKYPCWYETLQGSGYDVIKQSELFDYTFAGTETRDSKPQTQACWYQSWLNDIGDGKCEGGWYDPLSSPPDIYVEQARQTILGGAKESLLHCYDYLDSDNKGIAMDKDSQVKYGKVDALALINEIEGLQQMADLISTMKPQGVLLAKKPNESPKHDFELLGKIGMLGIPFIGSANIKQNAACLFTAHASNFNNIEIVINKCINENTPFIVSSGFYNALDERIKKQFNLEKSMPENTYLLRDINGETVFLNDLFTLDETQLDWVRNKLILPFGIQINAPKNVSLHLFTSDQGNAEVIENFNDETVFVKISFNNAQKRVLKLGLPSINEINFQQENEKEYLIQLEPHTLALIGGDIIK